MKILWFTNAPCGATEKLTGKPVTGGGWLYALSENLITNPEIELHIAFYWGEAMPEFTHKGITYHPVLRNGDGSKFGRVIQNYTRFFFTSNYSIELARLKEVIAKVSPDVIHIHGSEDNFGLLAKEGLPQPIVLSVQGLLSPIYNKLYAGFTKEEIKQSETWLDILTCSGIAAKDKSMRRRSALERDFFPYIKHVIGRTSWDKACTLALNPNRNYHVVGEILRNEFFGKKWNKSSFSTPFVLTSVISFGFFKGYETIFRTAQILKRNNFDFRWNVIGALPSDSAVKLSEKLCQCSANSLNINLLGRKSAAEMVESMLQSDTFVQVSHIENSPNSLCEAMLLGMPCIATFAGGTASMLENNVEGRLLQDGDPYAMAGMIMEMAADNEQARAFGRKAAERAAERHKPERVCKQLMDVYNEILIQ